MIRIAFLTAVASANDIQVNLIPGASGALSGLLKKQASQTSRDVSSFESAFNSMIGSASHAAFAEFASQQGNLDPLMSKLKHRLLSGGHYTKTAIGRLMQLAKIPQFRKEMDKHGIANAALSVMQRESTSPDMKGAAGSLVSTLAGGRPVGIISADPATGGTGRVFVYLNHPGASLSEKASGPYDRTTQAPYVWVSQSPSFAEFLKENHKSFLESSGFSSLDVFVEQGAESSSFGETFQNSLAPIAKRTNLLRSKRSFAQVSDDISGPLSAIAGEMSKHFSGNGNAGLIQELVDEAKQQIAAGGSVGEAVGNAAGGSMYARTKGGLLTMQSTTVPNTDEVKNRLSTTAPMAASAISVNIFDQ